MRVSELSNRIEPSLARHLFNLAKDFDDTIDLTLGDPDFDVPMKIKQAAYKAIEENRTHYSANSGLIEARKAVIKHIEENWGKEYDESQVIITVGGMEALYLSLSCMINPGDEVIIFAPYYVNYLQMIRICGGIPIIVDAYDLEKGFQIDANKLKSYITSRTIAIIVNTPCNPSGFVLSRQSLKEIANLAIENDLTVISDEVYRTLIYDNMKHESILQFNGMQERTVLIDSLSKEYCMTGWRVGFAAANTELISNMTKMQENVAACTPLMSQYALIEAYNHPESNVSMLNEFKERRDFLYENLSKIKGLNCKCPQGTFYLFLNIEDTGLKAMDFAIRLLQEEHVAVVPGNCYGDNYDNYIRIAFTKKINVLKKAVAKIEHFISNLS
ncbi:MAG: pyridoxal phosphate-dependent aminotransferase [Prevotella sp.]|nr:pyridoxal phosphate-dependent aminotransferase [Prevotella sp.]